jgi:hypothetical protein
MNNLFDRFLQFTNTFYSMFTVKSKVKLVSFMVVSFNLLCVSVFSFFSISEKLVTLMIIQDADSLFKCRKTHPYVKHIVGFDSNRLCEYEMWYCDSFPFPVVSKLRI